MRLSFESYHVAEVDLFAARGFIGNQRAGLINMHMLPYYRPVWVLFFLAIAGVCLAGANGFAQTPSETAGPSRLVAVWPSGPLDVVAVFATPIDPAAANALVGKTIAYSEPGRSRAAGPAPARAVGSLRIVAARLSDGGRTLTLATDPHPRLARYVLPARAPFDRPRMAGSRAGETGYDLTGFEAIWTPEGSPDDRPAWTSWWPAVDVEQTRKLTRGSKRHEDELGQLARPGLLVVSAFVRLPGERVTVRIESSGPIEDAILGESQAEKGGPEDAKDGRGAILTSPSAGEPLFLSITCRTGADGRPFSLRATYSTAADQAERAIERERAILPWAPVPTTAATAPLVVPDLAGGDAVRGQAIFNGEQGRCAQCHTWRGQGGKIGPDLTEIGKKGRAEIYRAIAAPSASIEPDYLTYSVATKNGQVVLGIVRAEGADAIRVLDTNAHATIVPRQEIEQIRPSANSIMPVGLTGALGASAVRDLVALLTSDPANAGGTRSR